MKVAHLSTCHNCFDTRIFYKECVELERLGYDVYLIAQHNKKETVKNIKIIPLKRSYNRFFRMTVTMTEMIIKCIRVNADIYHIHDPELLLLARLLKYLGKVVIFDMHEEMPASILSKAWIHPKLRNTISVMYSKMEEKLLRDIPVIFAEHSYAKKYRFKQTEIILNYPQLSNFRNIKEDKYDIPSIGYLGDVTENRGILTILEAIIILEKYGIFLNFECIGNIESKTSEVIKKKTKLINKSKIYLRGRVNLPEALKIMSKCHIGLCVLKDTPNSRHSYPTKLFE